MKQIYSQPPSNLGRNHTTTTPYCTWIAIGVVMWLLVAPVVANTTRYSNDNAPCMTTDTEDNNLNVRLELEECYNAYITRVFVFLSCGIHHL